MPSDDSFRKLTDEQLVWLFINQLVDNDEKLERMCPDCRDEVTSKCKCTRCGKPMLPHDEYETFVNPNFNEEEYRLKAEI